MSKTLPLLDALSEIFNGYSIPKSREQIELLLESPKDSSFGDIAFPCHVLAKELKKAPPVIAKEILEKLIEDKNLKELFSKIEIAGPYINLTYDSSKLAADLIPNIDKFLDRKSSQNTKVMIEYSQPNTHKAFHVGHVRNASLGDSLCRIFNDQGFDVVPVNYLGDEGTHVAKCIWYYEKFHKNETPTSNKGEFLGVLYTKANNLIELDALTNAPHIGVVVAEISDIKPHSNPKWRTLEIKLSDNIYTVVTGATGGKAGDKIAFAKPGTRFNGKIIDTADKGGVQSQGMVLSEKELLGNGDNQKIYIFENSAPLGEEVAEIFRTDNDKSDKLLNLIKNRESEVSKVLQGIESGSGYYYDLWLKTKEWSLDEFKEIYKWLGCSFERYFLESEFGERSKQTVRKYQQKGIFVESDGAIGADLKEYGLGFCILIKRDGTALYATRDLTLAEDKFNDFKIDKSIYVVDSAQTLHFQQVFKCLELMGYEKAKLCYHLPYAQVVRPDGKMSSRKGNVILFSELKSLLLNKITSEYLEKYKGDWSDSEIELAANRIAKATIRYGMLKQENNSQVIFDLDEWAGRSGNTGPYMLYAVARINSILREATSTGSTGNLNPSLLTHESEQSLLRHILNYDQVRTKAMQQYAPHTICTFVFELAKEFNRFYKNCSVMNAETTDLKQTRIDLIQAVQKTLIHGLNLLGIDTVERM
jgi:arginyl-tRNA synthetase